MTSKKEHHKNALKNLSIRRCETVSEIRKKEVWCFYQSGINTFLFFLISGNVSQQRGSDENGISPLYEIWYKMKLNLIVLFFYCKHQTITRFVLKSQTWPLAPTARVLESSIFLISSFLGFSPFRLRGSPDRLTRTLDVWYRWHICPPHDRLLCAQWEMKIRLPAAELGRSH